MATLIDQRRIAKRLLFEAEMELTRDPFGASEKAQEALDILRDICNKQMILNAREEDET